MLPRFSGRATGVLLVTGACLCWSSGGILVRLLEMDGAAIAFWRSLFMAVAVASGLVVIYRRRMLGVVGAVGWPGVLSGMLLAVAFLGYILSLSHTQVANTLVLMSVSPLIAAALAWLLLKEPLSRPTALSIAAAMIGIAVMFWHGMGAGSLMGDGLALLVALSFGANIVVLRRWRDIDMIPATVVGGLLSALATLPWAIMTPVNASDLLILAGLGFFQLGLGLALFVRGSRYLSAAELGLLTLLETVLAPLWVWIGIGETPGLPALLGGSLVMAAVAGATLASRPAYSGRSSA